MKASNESSARFRPLKHSAAMMALLASGLACIALLLSCTAIPNADNTENRGDPLPLSDSAIGVVETKSNMAQSRMVFYDDSLNEIGSLPFQEAQMEQVWGNVSQVGDAVYLAPFGDFKTGAGHEVLEISLANGTTTRHDVGESVLAGCAATDRFAFAYNNLNGAASLIRCDKQTGETKKIEIPEDIITNVTCTEGKVWAFADREVSSASPDPSSTNVEEQGMLYCYDNDLNLLDTFDLSTFGSGIYRTLVKDNRIFFTRVGGSEGKTTSTLGVFDTATGKLATVSLDHAYANGLALDGNKLYISYCDVIADRSSAYAISVYDLNDGSLNTHEVPLAPVEIAVSRGKLYVLDSFNRQLAVLDPATCEVLHTVEVSSMDNDYSYLGNLIPMPEKGAE